MGNTLIISVALPLLALTIGWIFKMRQDVQERLDRSRLCYTVTFPTGTTELMIQDFLRSVRADLIPNKGDGGAVPTVVFEIRWTQEGIRNMLRVTPQDNGHVLAMLEAHIPGVTYDPVDTPEESIEIDPVFSVDVVMTDKSKPLAIKTADSMVRSILTSVPPLKAGEQVVYQVIVSYAARIALPATKGVANRLILGSKEISPEDMKQIQERSVMPLLNASIRVAVQAVNEERGRQLASGLNKTFKQANTDRTQIVCKVRKGQQAHQISYALTPMAKTAQFNIAEAAAFFGMPVGDPVVAGLHQGAARRLHPTGAISSTGEWLLGHSDVHGSEKRITLSKEDIPEHMSVVGKTGTGKSEFLRNGATQYAKAGLGIFVIDAGQDIAIQRLYYRVLEAMPPERAGDVICINPAADPNNPVSINILDQGFGKGAISIIKGVFEAIYHDMAKGTVTVAEIIEHGLLTLMEAGTDDKPYSMIDLASLIAPRNEKEWRWATHLIRNVKDTALQDFWDRHPQALHKLDSRDRDKWDQYIAPTQRRLWQIASRTDLRYLFGQSKSTVRIKDVLQDNKILLFSVGGMDDPEAASIAASMMTQMAWVAAQSVRPKNPNIMFLDEFQVSANVQGGLPDMLARGRALNLGLVLATQYVTRTSIPTELQGALLGNTATHVVFRSGSKEANAWAREFGGKTFGEDDITRLEKFHAVAQVANSAPVTFKALKPAKPTYLTKQILEQSRRQYGRPVDQVRAEIDERRTAPRATKSTVDKPVGSSPYDMSEDDFNNS